MFVKIYQYHIQKEKENEFFALQNQVSEIYRKHIDFHTTYLQSKTDETKWLEITKYKDETDYNQSIQLINEEEEVEALFHAVQSLLVDELREVSEENFTEKKCINTFNK
jgi:hypothetical protein